VAAETVFSPFTPAGEGQFVSKPAEFRVETTEITPDLAKEWMDRHARVVAGNRAANGGKARDNRPVRWDDVDGYARDMKAGKWDLNGESIKIAWDGTVPDGQHRLRGCVKAGVPFRSVVVTGVDPESQDTMDTGNKRRLSDQLAIAEEENAAVLAGVAKWSLRWLRGIRTSGGSAGYSPTQPEMLEYIEAAPALRTAAAYAVRARKDFKMVRVSVYAMAWMVFHGIDWAAAEVFLERVADGEDLHSGHPALGFRNRMINAKAAGEKLTEHQQFALMICAWNAFREDRKMSRPQLPQGGLTPRNFPEPK
jgi:hypothetical protein